MSAIVSSAPGKVILFGEHAVNRHQPALATAIDLRVVCRASNRSAESGKIAVKVINHYGDEVLKVYEV